jgi:hypothetical protein
MNIEQQREIKATSRGPKAFRFLPPQIRNIALAINISLSAIACEPTEKAINNSPIPREFDCSPEDTKSLNIATTIASEIAQETIKREPTATSLAPEPIINNTARFSCTDSPQVSMTCTQSDNHCLVNITKFNKQSLPDQVGTYAKAFVAPNSKDSAKTFYTDVTRELIEKLR